MPPAPKRNCSVILFDANCRNKAEAVQFLIQVALAKNQSLSKDEIKLIIVNKKAPNGISIVENIKSYNPYTLLEEINKEHAPDPNGNWLNSLYIGLKELETFAKGKGVLTLQLLFITDLTTEISSKNEPNLLKNITKFINSHDIFVYFVGPKTPQPTVTLKSMKDVNKWMKNISFPAGENWEIIQNILQNTPHTVVANYQLGFHLFFGYKNPRGAQAWSVPLSFGQCLSFNAATKRFLKKGPLVKVKTVRSEDGGSLYDFHWVEEGNETVKLDSKDVISGVKRHNVFVPIHDSKMFRVSGPRCFKVQGFTDASNIPECLLIGGDGSNVVHALPNSNESALTTLIHCLAQQNKYAVAKRVYNANNNPKFVALIPKPEENVFHMAELPYSNDIRKINYDAYTEEPEETDVKTKIVPEIYEFCKQIDTTEENCKLQILLTPNMMQDDESCRIVNKLSEKLLGKERGSCEWSRLAECMVKDDDVLEPLRAVWAPRGAPEGIKQADEDEAMSDFDSD